MKPIVPPANSAAGVPVRPAPGISGAAHSSLRPASGMYTREVPEIVPVAPKAMAWPVSRPQSVEVRIEELVLHGFSRGDRHAIADAVQGELARLFGEESLPPGLLRTMEIGEINGGSFHAREGERRQTTGARVARAIYGGLRR